MDEPYQAKLGHHLGQIYSRVGTEDWVPSYRTLDQFNQLITTHLDELCEWVADARLKDARKALKDETLDALGNDYMAVRRAVSELDVKSRQEKVAERIVQILGNAGVAIRAPEATKLRNLLLSDPKLELLMKET